MNIPNDATHIWTYGYDNPIAGWFYRRHFYKQIDGNWFSMTVDNRWAPSGNDEEWFNKETEEGFFVTREQFMSPDFVSKKEKQHGNA